MEEAVLSGRWPLADLFEELPAIGLCTTHPFRAVVENALNSSADVLERSRPPGGPMVPCEAISLAIGFRGFPGMVGPSAPFPSVPSPCP